MSDAKTCYEFNFEDERGENMNDNEYDGKLIITYGKLMDLLKNKYPMLYLHYLNQDCDLDAIMTCVGILEKYGCCVDENGEAMLIKVEFDIDVDKFKCEIDEEIIESDSKIDEALDKLSDEKFFTMTKEEMESYLRGYNIDDDLGDEE